MTQAEIEKRTEQRRVAAKQMAAEDIANGTARGVTPDQLERRIHRAFERQDQIDRAEGGRS